MSAATNTRPSTATSWSTTVTVHGIGRPERVLDQGEDEVWIGVEEFEALLDVAAEHPHVTLTFDDGNASDIEIGLPRLLDRGLRARFFVPAGLLGEPGRLDAAGVRELHAAGMLVGSHGWAHRDWRTLDWTHDSSEVHEEMVRAREVLAGLVGSDSAEVAVPFGSYNRHVLAALRRSGATRVYTSDGGWARPGSWLQPRNSIRAGDGRGWAQRLLASRPPLSQRTRSHVARSIKRWRS